MDSQALQAVCAVDGGVSQMVKAMTPAGWLFVGLVVFLLNAVVGAGVLSAIDSDDKELFRWYDKAPNTFFSFMTLELWPIVVWLYLRGRGSAS